jgi:hypothetical protein
LQATTAPLGEVPKKMERSENFFWNFAKRTVVRSPEGRRTAVREVERSLRRNPAGIAAQRFAAWRSGGFLAQKFNRRTTLEPTTKLSYEALHPPLRQTAVMPSPFFFVCLFVIVGSD